MTDPADSPVPDSTEAEPNEAATSTSPTPAVMQGGENDVPVTAEASGDAPSQDAPSQDATSQDATSQDAPAEGPSSDAEQPPAEGEAGAGAEAPEVEAGAEGEAAEGEGEGKKKRRRRRRKKKKAEGEAGAEAGAEAAPAEAARKKDAHLPFQKLFDGAARRHAFSVGEIVAGRVSETREGVAVIDLFGKALAYTRLHEPREIPVAPQVDEEAEASEQTDAEPQAAETQGAVQAAEPQAAELQAAESQAAGATEAPSSEAASQAAEAQAVAPSTEAVEASEADAVVSEPAGDLEPTMLEGLPAERPADARTDEAAQAAPREAGAPEAAAEAAAPEADDTADSVPPPPPSEPVAEPAYVLEPEGVPPLEAGAIFRGRVGAVAESGHIAIVNELVDVKSTRAYLRQARDTRARVPGLVFGFNRGGFDILVHGLRAFCPVSGLTLDMVEDPSAHLGQWGQFHVQAAKSGVQGLVVSRRSILEKEARKRAKAFLKSLESGQTVRGRVTQVREFGVFVDIGGVEGLLHQSELSWERGVRPSDVAKVGDELEVKVLNVHERESKRERHDRISLSLKALQPDPWRAAAEELVEGQPRKGTVVRTADFGAFVQLAPGIDGLLHISEFGRDIKHADQAVQVGDEIHVVVERIDKKQRRVALSKLSPEDAEAFEKGELTIESTAPRLKVGGAIKVRVTQIAPVGLHVQVDNVVGKRGRGFIPNAEMGTARGTDHRRQWPPGTEIDVVIIGTDRDGGMRCSRKRFLQDEERRAVREYRKEVSKQGFGTFGDILRQKLGTDQEGTQ